MMNDLVERIIEEGTLVGAREITHYYKDVDAKTITTLCGWGEGDLNVTLKWKYVTCPFCQFLHLSNE
jgi:hypothetical protein